MQIYVVIGKTGAYVAQYEWITKAFTDQKLAKDYMKECQAYADSCDLKDLSERDQQKANSPDPHFNINYIGKNYRIETHELVTDKFVETILKDN
jgi:hypothetical protein